MANTNAMSNQEIRQTIAQMLKDWDALTPEQRNAALNMAATAAHIKREVQ
jgi:hypothetical protein